MSVKIKSLVWEEPEFFGANPSHAPHTSSTTMGLYFANEHAFWYEGGPANSADNLEAAKAAAQADYETRIRSALESCDPMADLRVWELVEAVEDGIKAGLLPKTSASEGGAAKYSAQVRAADRLRAALAAFDKGGKDE